MFRVLIRLNGSPVTSSLCSIPRTAPPCLSSITSQLSKLSLYKPTTTDFRSLSTTQATFLKEIVVNESDGQNIVIKGKYVASSRNPYLVKNDEFADKKVCPLCALNLNLMHTDVLVLSQFVRPDGRLLPRRITGICSAQQYKLTLLVTMAKKAGLMAMLGPPGSHKDPSKRRGSRAFKRYFDEDTISDGRLKRIIRYNPAIGGFTEDKQFK